MRRKRNMVKLVLVLMLFGPINVSSQAIKNNGPKPESEKKKDAPPQKVFVGIETNRSYDANYTKFGELYEHLKSIGGTAFEFSVAFGTYDEVIEWYKNQLVDVALLSAGPFAKFLSQESKDNHKESGGNSIRDELNEIYIGSQDRKTTQSLLARPERNKESPERKKGSPQLRYQSVCVLAKSSNVTKFDQIQERAERGLVRFIFTDPLSASGYLLPASKLWAAGIDLKKNKVEWSFDHDDSISALVKEQGEEATKDDPGTIRVAFVTDKTCDPDTSSDKEIADCSKIQKIDFPELDSEWIPSEILLVRQTFKSKDLLLELLGVRAVPEDKAPGEVSASGFYKQKDIYSGYGSLVEAVKRVDKEYPQYNKGLFGLDGIFNNLSKYKRRNNKPARLALVLSGGGAKCAYQIGAINEIEKYIEEYKKARENKDIKEEDLIDIDLVVGTSGGAINALCAAMGVTKSGDDRAKLLDTWLSFDQQNFIRPNEGVRVTFGIFLGLLQAIFIFLMVRLFARRKQFITQALKEGEPKRKRINWRWWGTVGIILLIVGAVEMTIFRSEYTPWQALAGLRAPRPRTATVIALIVMDIFLIITFIRQAKRLDRPMKWYRWAMILAVEILVVASALSVTGFMIFGEGRKAAASLSTNHILHHTWLVATISLDVVGIGSITLGAALLFVGWRILKKKKTNKEEPYIPYDPAIMYRLIAACVIIFLIHLVLLLFAVETLSGSEGIEKAIAARLPGLLKMVPASGEDTEHRLESISKFIMSDRPEGKNKQGCWIQRDLVITSSRLPGERINDPFDLYFYYRDDSKNGSERWPKPPDQTIPRDNRFVPIERDSPMLLNVVIGSSSIYPVFPYKPARWLNSQCNLIDGGFAHNSPIEAAVRWGATHIILIEASEEKKPPKVEGFGENLVETFDYLFMQAQLTDAHSRKEVEIYSLRPEYHEDGEKKDNQEADAEDRTPTLCLFDFNPILISGAIQEGERDARGPEPRFQKERGAPYFRPIHLRPALTAGQSPRSNSYAARRLAIRIASKD